jgi:hypothetical protein
MKSRKPLLCALSAGALLFAGASAAQETPVPAPPPPSATPAMPSASGDSATYQTPQGELTVRSVAAPAPIVGPAPPFQQLSGGSKSITEAQAAAYPPLANDFLNADHNKNGRITAAEYQQWLKQL